MTKETPMDEQCNHADQENVLLLTDDDGNDIPFALLDEIELDDKRYAVLAPLEEDEDEDDEDGGVLIFRVEDNTDGTESFADVEDERELQRVFDVFRIDDEDYEFCDAE